MHLAAEVVVESTGALLHGTLAELSAGGATITVERDAHAGERVLVRFGPEGREIETLPAEILRIEHAAGSPRRHLHCRFLGLTTRIEALLLHLIAERQRDLLRREP